MSRRSHAPKPSLGMAGAKSHRTSLKVAHAAMKSRKRALEDSRHRLARKTVRAAAAQRIEVVQPTLSRHRGFSSRSTVVPHNRPFAQSSRKSEFTENGHWRPLTSDVGENRTERSFGDRLEVRGRPKAGTATVSNALSHRRPGSRHSRAPTRCRFRLSPASPALGEASGWRPALGPRV
jgi:hypothetical protein